MSGAAAGAEDAPRRFLIATAVSEYMRCSDWNRPGLNGVLDSVISLFTEQLGYRHQIAFGPNPTKACLKDQLRNFCRSPDRRKDDLLAVYITGHGEILDKGSGSEHVLLMADTDPKDITHTSLRTQELAETILRDTKVRRLLLLLDTCYSGQGGNELAAAALEGINLSWKRTNGSGLVIVSSAHPHQQAEVGLFPRLFTEAVGSRSIAGHGPQALSVAAVVQRINDSPARPDGQRIGLSQIGLTGEPPPFLVNPRHNAELTDVDLAIQQAAEIDVHTRRRETEMVNRLLVRAMGYHGDAMQGWWFCGRRTAMKDLTTWLRASSMGNASACMVVTAGPGSGKTALLGLVAALTHRERRRTVPLDALRLSPELLPEEGAVDVAVYAQGLADRDVLEGLAAAARIRAGSVGEFLAALGKRDGGRPLTVLIDALDEAATPDTLCKRILRPLIEYSDGRVRLLLGTRRHLLPHLGLDGERREGGDQVIDLDSRRYADRGALLEYTARGLLEAHTASPYRKRAGVVREVAEAVVTAAGMSFLVARIAAGTLAASPAVPDPSNAAWREKLPREAGSAMRDDLEQRLGDDAERAADLLRPLAFAEGQGLPWEDIWAPLASALSGRRYGDEDLLWLRGAAGSYVVEAIEDGRSAYRLYHQALVEHLRDGIDEKAAHAAVTTVLIGRVPVHLDGSRDWSRAHPYTLKYLAAHAAKADRVDEILKHEEAEYLVYAEPRALSGCSLQARGGSARLIAAVYRTSFGVHAKATPAERRQWLAIDAARAGANSLRRALADRIHEGAWTPRWATGSQFHPELLATLAHKADEVIAVANGRLRNGDQVLVTLDKDGFAQFGKGGVIRVWDLASGALVRKFRREESDDATWLTCTVLADGTPVVVGMVDLYRMRVWDLETAELIQEIPSEWISMVACMLLKDRTSVAVACYVGGDIRVLDLASGALIHEFRPREGDILTAVACTVLRDGTSVAVTVNESGILQIWNLDTGAPDPINAFTVGGKWSDPIPLACTVLRDGRHIAIVSNWNNKLCVWDLESGDRIRKFSPEGMRFVNAVACAVREDGGQVVVAGGRNGQVRVWDLDSGRLLTKQLSYNTGEVHAVACAILPDGTPVALTGGDDRTARVWDLTLRDPVGDPVIGHTAEVVAVAAAELRDGTEAAVSVSGDGTAHVWNSESGVLIRSFMPVRVRSNDGDRISEMAVACTLLEDGTPVAVICAVFTQVVRGSIWDLESGVRRGRFSLVSDGILARLACETLDDGRIEVVLNPGLDGREARILDPASGKLSRKKSTGGNRGRSARERSDAGNGTRGAASGPRGGVVGTSGSRAGETEGVSVKKTFPVRTFSGRGKLIASVGADVVVFDRATGRATA